MPVREVSGLGRLGPDHRGLTLVGLVAVDPTLLAVQQLLQHLAVGGVGRRRHHGVDHLGLAIHAHVRLHPEVPLFTLLGLVHLGIALALGVLGRTGRGNDGRVHDGARRQPQPALEQDAADFLEYLRAELVLLQQMAKLA